MKNLLIALSLAVMSTAVFAQTPPADVKAIVGATVVDLDGGDPLADAVVLIEGERIVEIGAAGSVRIPDGAELIDADGAWLLPGLMNMHIHLGLVLPGKLAAELGDETVPELTLRMADNARGALYSGVTTIRLTGERAHTGIALSRAIAKGQAIGPRIFSAGDSVSITAGHGGEGKTFDGPYELMKGTRAEIAAGASWIKIAISGGIATDGGAIAEALMTPTEIAAVVDAAHRFDTPVTAHSGSSAATQSAIDAGIDCIEHGYTLDRKVLSRMADEGTWLVPTIVVSQPETQPFFERIGSPQWYLERRESVGKLHWKALQTAIEEGVNIALGTDMLPQEPIDGTTATVRAAEYYVEAGMTPVEALRSATIAAATLLGIQHETGSLQAGKYADIIAVTSDPADDISALRNIVLVMKGGVVYRNELSEGGGKEQVTGKAAAEAVEGLWAYDDLASPGSDPRELTGFIFFQDGLFSQQSIFDGEPFKEQMAMAHAGTYEATSGGVHLVAEQTVAILPEKEEPLSFRRDTQHDVTVSRSGDEMTLVFGAGTSTVQTFDRIGDGQGQLYPLEHGLLALVDGYLLLVSATEEGVTSGYGTFEKNGDTYDVSIVRWSGTDGTGIDYRRGGHIRLTFDGESVTLPDGQTLAVVE